MRILIVVQGHYGQRIADNIKKYGPADWDVFVYTFPVELPSIIDDAERFLPKEIPQVDLLISLGEHLGVAQTVPDLVVKSGARAVVAPADNRAWLPPGLAKQIKQKLASLGVEMVYPVPFCTLTEKDAQSHFICEFARYFGRPAVEIEMDKDGARRVNTIRGAPCGCTPYVAEGLVGVWERDAVEKAGLLHHQYPCLATMTMDQEFGDTLMHRAGLMTKLAVEGALKAARVVQSK